MLDATAGNRMMWKNKNPPNVVFMDKELLLYRPPDIFADHRYSPFRDNIFNCVIYDPPHKVAYNPPPYWIDPQDKSGRWFGHFKNKIEAISSIIKAQNEFYRISNRLCLKWAETSIPLWNILGLFKKWKIVMKKEHINKRNLGGKSTNKTYWVTFIKSQFKEKNDK